MKRTTYQIQCASDNGLSTFHSYAWNSARQSIISTLRAMKGSWEKIDSSYLKDSTGHYHGSEIWQSATGEKVRFVINRLDKDGIPVIASK